MSARDAWPPAAVPQKGAGAGSGWWLPDRTPVLRRGLCGLAQPCLKQPQHTPRFLFHEATLVLVAAGQLQLDEGGGSPAVVVDTPASLLLVQPGTCAELVKTPGGAEQRFRSVLLTLSSDLLEAFQRARPPGGADAATAAAAPFTRMPLDEDLAATLRHVVDSAGGLHLSDERLGYRLMDLLAALAERGHLFKAGAQQGTSGRLRTLIGEAPERHWTAQEAGRALAMSEATLRRRLAKEQVRFDVLLVDVRMHHALMLVQTTAWSIPRIAQACGYQSRARFAERFRARFGYLPSAVR
ncbi:AraC-like DNA-binding protein [Acidovorax soli]|uniref:AraC-like DNA-binding protein n=1 Tax=Acidovorax soli TaxID=592050 RepID=A0A7X0UAV6_9BURK|nr:helix-turn-helix transcriptional regulator [Acidovorax soli]MBB6561661.1 AraC-like DNA-binding protein [Acidovorax soli]